MTQLAEEGLPGHKPRIKTLDSLRGLAALIVVITHCANNLHYSWIIDRSPLYIFKAAHEAVIFFFLLSGYVLVYQYESKKFNYIEFLILRICRIYLPYLASVLFALVLYHLVYSNHADGSFFGSFWHLQLTPAVIVNHVILINNFNTDFFNPVIWSLVHEMRVAIIFPLLLLIVRLKPSIAILAGLLICAGSVILIVLDINPSKGFLNGYFYTTYYFYIFILGGLIVKNQSALMAWYKRFRPWQKKLFVAAALLLYTYAHTFSFFIRMFHASALKDYNFAFEDLLTAIAAFCLIIIAIYESRQRTFLDGKVPLFLGKISYSLYLIHLPVLIFTYQELHNKTSIWIILLLGVTASIGLAALFNLLVERKAVKLGKLLTRIFSRIINSAD